ncbi:MAG TPA: hypothetical protein GXZ65_00795 [Clostridiales bacterium]|jgi:hypothetical protein|nr:hypothetical protein [Clostridiales bacterium]
MSAVFVEVGGVRLDCLSFKAVSSRKFHLVESIGEAAPTGAAFGEKTLTLEIKRILTGSEGELGFIFDQPLTITAVNGETRRIYTSCLVEEITETQSEGKVTQIVKLRALGLIEDGERA